MTPGRVLVTGGSGRLGRFVVNEIQRHAEVTVLDRVPPPADLPYVIVDVRDLKALSSAAAGHDAVVHLAGLDSGVHASEHDYFHVNVQGTWNVLAAAEEAGIDRVAVCGSIAAYGMEAVPPRLVPDCLPFDEEHRLRPDVAYDLSKQVVEQVAAAFARRGMTIPCLRPAWVVFPETIADFARRSDEADGGGPVPPGHRPLPAHRAYVRPDDVASAFWLALTADLEPFEVLNIGASDTMSPAPTLDVIKRTFAADIPITDPALFEHFPRAAVFSSSRAQHRLGWQPSGDWSGFVADPPPSPFAAKETDT